MSSLACPIFVAFAFGAALGVAGPAPGLVAAAGFSGIEIPPTTTLRVAATALPADGLVPTAVAIDDQGRILIVERARGGDEVALGLQPQWWSLSKLAAQTTADNPELLEKWQDQLPPAARTASSGRVRRLADANGDGLFEHSTTLVGGPGEASAGSLGAVFAAQGNVYLASLPDAPPNPWIDEHLGELQYDLQPAYVLPPAAQLSADPLGLTIHPGTGLLEAEAGRLLICEQAGDAAHSGIGSYQMEPAGAGMHLAGSRPLLRGIAATAAQYSWDGRLVLSASGDPSLYTLDAGPNTWRAAEAAATAKLVRDGVDQRESAELAALLRHPDSRVRLRAQIALTRRPDALQRFAAATGSTEQLERIHGIWGLGILARRGSGSPVAGTAGFGSIPDNRVRTAAGQQIASLLKHPDPETRAQAASAIGDAQNQFIRPPDVRKRDTLRPSVTYMTADGLPLASLLFDESPRVRYFAAISIGKLKILSFYSPLCDFLKANNNRDPYLRHAGIFALQHIVTDPGTLAGLDRHPSPAVRLAATVALRRMHDPAAATFINDADAQVADEAIRAVTDLSLDEVRVSLAFLLDDLAARPRQALTLRRLVHNAFRLGSTANAARLLKLVGDPAIPIAVQQECLRLLALWLEPPPVDQLTGCWRPLAKRPPAEIKPALSAALPRLLQLDGGVRAAALDLAQHYQLPVPESSPP